MRNIYCFFYLPYRWLSRWVLLSILTALCQPVFSQLVASHQAPPATDVLQDTKTFRSLESVLMNLETTYQINIVFDNAIIRDKHVDPPQFAPDDWEKSLLQLLQPLGLTLKKIKDDVYVVKALPHQKESIKKLPRKTPAFPSSAMQQKLDLPFRFRAETARKRALEKTISGKVTDIENGDPLPGVNILAKGTTQGTVSDVDGNYRLTVNDEVTTLVFSSIGYTTQEVDINSRTVINLQMAPDVQALSEVVVVGFGTQKKVNLTGAVSSIQSEELENRPITNATQALQGMQGVYINQVGGQPGRDAATIRIRGVGTLNNSNPLVLVDGIEFSLDDVNPDDIESISVLKDAASAAIYGSRAANGVVLVTTKKGGQKSQITYSGSVGLQEVISLPAIVRDPILWFELYSQAQLNVGTDPSALAFSQSLIDEYRAGMKTDPTIYPKNDWYDIIFNPAFIQDHNLRFSGGNEKTNFALSFGMLDQDGVMRGTSSELYNFNLNVESKLNENITVGATANTSYRTWDESVQGTTLQMAITLRAQSFQPTYIENGNYAMQFFDIPGFRRYPNPLAIADEGENKFKNIKLFSNTYAEVKLPLDIIYKLNIGVTSTNLRQQRFTPEIPLYDVKTKELSTISAGGPIVPFGRPRGTDQRDDESLNTTIFNTLRWNKLLEGQSEISILLGQSYERFTDGFFTAYNEGYLNNDLFELNAGSSNPAVSGTGSESRLTSYFGRINYALKDKYLFEGNFRYDGSSRFAKGNQWGFFPSVSAGWRLNEEPFLKEISWIDQLKIRSSWGQLGNERIGLFRYADLVSLGQDYSFGGSVNPGTAVLVDNEKDISWETTTITNLGLDAAFFEGRLSASLEYFLKTTNDVLRPVGIPSQVGALGGPIRNIGKVENDGLEIALGYRNTVGNFRYELSGNLTYITNEVTDLDGEIIIDDFSIDGRGPLSITQEGAPINQFLLFQSDGLFQSQSEIDAHADQGSDTRPGYIRFKDLDNNGVIDINDRVAEGNTIPKYTYSFNVDLAYRNFSLNTLWQGVGDVQTYNKHISGVPFWFGGGLPVEWVGNSWTPDNPGASLPLLTRYEDAQTTNFRDSDFWLQDASYLRLKNIQLTYTFDPDFLDRLGLNGLSFFVNAQNLITITSLDAFDPETELLGGNFFNYPSVKTYTFGLNVSF